MENEKRPGETPEQTEFFEDMPRCTPLPSKVIWTSTPCGPAFPADLLGDSPEQLYAADRMARASGRPIEECIKELRLQASAPPNPWK
jgi:hypothetical protein